MFTNHLKRFLPLCLAVAMWLVSAVTLNAADITSVTGTVVDELDEPIIGAVIRELNTKNTSITNIDGEFVIKISSKNPVLEITYLGYATQKINVTSSKINVQMHPQANDLDEVVVVAYGQQKKVTVTGSVASVSSAEIKRSSEPNLSAALAGKLPGLTTLQNSGAPGEDDVTMYLRGAATTNGKNPLILVDGIPRESMGDIDPNEVATITVLKDASSTAVFGVRGANGVILVTTKRGEEGKVNVHGQVNYSQQRFSYWPKTRHSYDYARLVNEACDNEGLPHEYSDADLAIYDMWKNGGPEDPLTRFWYPDQNWRDILLKDHSDMVQANVNLSGGSKKLKYFVSAGYVYQGGMYNTESKKDLGYDPQSKMNRYNIRANLDYTFNNWISASLDVSSYIKKYSSADSSVDGSSSNEFRLQALVARPTSAGPIVPDLSEFGQSVTAEGKNRYYPGKIGAVVQDPLLSLAQAPYGLLNRSGYRQTVVAAINSVGTLNLNLDMITKGLSARGVVSFETYGQSQTWSRKSFSGYRYNLDPTGYDQPVLLPQKETDDDSELVLTRQDLSRWFVNLQAQINYNRTFNRLHNVTGMLLFQRDEKEDMAGSIPYNMIGTAARFTYAFDSRYLAEVNMGYNGSEQFAPKNRFGFFPAFSIGWVASNESFMKRLYENGMLTKLKFRASIGKVGNDVLSSDRFLYLDHIATYSSGSFESMTNNVFDYMNVPTSLNKTNIIKEVLLGNNKLRWETAWKQNYAVDITCFNGLDLTFDYFIEHRSDILMTRKTIPMISGLLSDQLPRSNFGKVNNRGFEITAAYRYAVNKDVNFSINGNFAYAKNKVIFADEVNLGEDYAYPFQQQGFSMGQCWGYRIDYSVDPERGLDGTGFFNTQEQIDLRGLEYQGVGNGNYTVGDFVYQDLNDDGIIDKKDLAPIGYSSLLPRITYGVTLSGQVYGFDFSVMLQGVGQYTKQYGGGFIMYEEQNAKFFNDMVDNHRWTKERYEAGEKIVHPRLSAQGSSSHANNDYYTMDASYIRLKNVQIGYTIPKKLTKKIGFNNVRFYVSADNLHTWNHLRTKMIDPEQKNAYSYPLMKTYTAGVSIDL